MELYCAQNGRYEAMSYRRCGKSGLLLSALSLGMWYNFGARDSLENARTLVRCAFDHGVTHFDLANNYGPPPGAAEETFGALLRSDLSPYRDELVISTKAGYQMWPGPYGNHGSRKYLLASLDQSLRRLGLDYVDIFYHHCMDPDTPLEESMGALAQAVHSGKALYVGVSNYSPEKTEEAYRILRAMGVRCLIHQPCYNLLNRDVAKSGLLDTLSSLGIGCIPYSPLAQGLLSGKYGRGVPESSRAAREEGLRSWGLTVQMREKLQKIAEFAQNRGQTTAQMALTWLLSHQQVTSVLVGARNQDQLLENLGAVSARPMEEEEMRALEALVED
jgi:L-glyceraldehyde 3-phosphate reductase